MYHLRWQRSCRALEKRIGADAEAPGQRAYLARVVFADQFTEGSRQAGEWMGLVGRPGTFSRAELRI